MRRGLNFDTLFPMKDPASARLMLVKARCLLAAEVISESEALEVARRANAIRSACEAGINASGRVMGFTRAVSSLLASGAPGPL
jgi:hypothetical protein